MTHSRTLIVTGVVLAVSFAAAAHAEEIFFPENQYGSVELTLPQSTGFQLEAQLTLNKNFEPLSSYASSDPLRQLSQAIGRLDILYRGKGVVTCTASVISPDHILTNEHCVPGPVELGSPDRASLLMGYYTDEQEGTRRYDVDIEPVESNRRLDYAILRVFGKPSARWKTVEMAATDPTDLSSLLLIHHPNGKRKHVTRGGCRSAKPATETSRLRHTCDTKPGSSGAPIVTAPGGVMVGLHFGGPVNPQPGDVNLGSRVATLAENSPIIRQLVRRPEPEEPVVVDPAAPQSPEVVFWETIRDSDDPQMFQAYLDRYPEGEFAVLAEIKLVALAPVPDPGQPSAPKIQIEPLSQQMVATSDANVRAGPATDARRLGLIRQEQTVEVTGRVRDADWYLISYAGNDAFVYAPLLTTPDQTTPAAPAAADFKPDNDAGVAAYEAGAYATALLHFGPLAQDGNADAQYNLGVMYRMGTGVPRDDAEAVAWYRRAAEQGHSFAQESLSGALLHGLVGVPKDREESNMWLQRAVEGLPRSSKGLIFASQ